LGVAFFGVGSSSSSSSSTTFLGLPRFFGGSWVSLGLAAAAGAAGLPPKNDLMSDGIMKYFSLVELFSCGTFSLQCCARTMVEHCVRCLAVWCFGVN
jgi:hypothetical protein